MNPGKLDMLANGIHHDLAMIGHGIHLHLFRMLDELTYHHRMLLADVGGQFQETLQLLLIRADIHGGATQHVTRANQHGEAYLRHEAIDILHGRKLFPAGLIHADTIQHGGELLTVLGITSARQLLVWMQTTPETLDASASYLRIFFLGMVPTMLYNMGSGILRAMGDSKRPLYYLFVCVVANIALDLLFVIVFQWGIEGAAAATALSQVVCAALVVRALRRLPEEQRLLYDREELDRGILRRMLHVGIPAALQSSMYGIANIVLQVGINMLGTDSMAGWTAFNKFDDYYWPISNAIGIAVMTYVGQNFGAGDRERVHESIHKGLLIHLTTSALFSVIIFSGRYPMMHLFVGDDPTVIAIGAQVTALIAPCYVLFTLVEVLSATMRGVGDAVVPAAITMVFTCIVRLIYLWGYAFSHNSNLTIAVIYPISWVLTSIAFLLYYKSRKWMPKGFHF